MNIHATASNILATSSVKLESPPISGDSRTYLCVSVCVCLCVCVCVSVFPSVCYYCFFSDCRIYLFSSLAARVFNKLTRYSFVTRYCISGGDASINIGDLNFIQATKVTNISYTTSQVIHIQVAIYIYK